MSFKYKRLNIGWNAQPNAPEVELKTESNNLILTFYLNPYIYKNVNEYDKGKLTFKNCFKYSFNDCNDEGYFLEQYRYKNEILSWGNFYELLHDWENDFHPDYKCLNSEVDKGKMRHFIFFFRDNTLECIAEDFEFVYLNDLIVSQS